MPTLCHIPGSVTGLVTAEALDKSFPLFHPHPFSNDGLIYLANVQLDVKNKFMC